MFRVGWGMVADKRVFNENQGLKNEIARLKTASEEIKVGHKSDLTAKIQNRRVAIILAPLH